jgi:hypothetical protein
MAQGEVAVELHWGGGYTAAQVAQHSWHKARQQGQYLVPPGSQLAQYQELLRRMVSPSFQLHLLRSQGRGMHVVPQATYQPNSPWPAPQQHSGHKQT